MHSFRWKIAAFLSSYAWHTTSASVVPHLEQSFFFDWNTPGQPYPIPVTTQCETIHITWQRSTATGPNPVAPYYLQVYTSAYLVPFIIPAGEDLEHDWAVPFAPGTLYQICMFDKNGNTGGCQDIYSVIPSNSTPSCTNVTFPHPLQVDATVINGPMSQYGWIDQCTDISLMPRNGTPPYIMTVAPSLHPPYNITSDGSSPFNWTVTLSWASSFFVSVIDSEGSAWSNGPLHSAGGGPTACLATGENPNNNGVSTGIAAGAGIGGLVIGLIVGLLGTWIILRSRQRKSQDSYTAYYGKSHPGSPQGALLHVSSHRSDYHAVPTSAGNVDTSMGPLNHDHNNASPYHIEPFVMPTATEDGHLSASATQPASPPSSPQPNSSRGRLQNVYVVHHDMVGQPPVTVYTEDGAHVVELPPGYPGDNHGPTSTQSMDIPHSRSGNDSEVQGSIDERNESGRGEEGSATGSSTNASTFLQQSRRPGQIRKGHH